MSMFEYMKTKEAIGKVHDSVGRGIMSTQAMQVLTELQLFGMSGVLDNKESREPMLSGLFKDEGFRSIMYNDYYTLSYFLKICIDNSMLYVFLRHALDVDDAPETIKTVTELVNETSVNVKFFDTMLERAYVPFGTIVANKLDWFPYMDSLSYNRSGNIPVNGSSSRIPTPARGYLCNIDFYKLNNGLDSGATKAVDEFKALGITVTVVIELGDEKLEFDVDSESQFFEGDLLSVHTFRCLTKDVKVYIKDAAQADMLYSEHDMFVCVTYRRVSVGSFN